MAAKIAEDCACGASLKYEGPIPSAVLSEWRRAHTSHAQRALARKEKEADRLEEITARIAGARGIHLRNWTAESELNQARETIGRIREILKEAENACDKYEKDSGITCGWKRTVLAVQEAVKNG